MPAVSPTLEYIKTSVLNAAQLRGMDATALHTGDLSFLTATGLFYYLDKASVAADDGVNVIATDGAVTVAFPLGDPAIPGRWIQGPCVGCGTNATGLDDNPIFLQVTADTTTPNNFPTSLLSTNITAPGGTALEIQFDASGDSTAGGGDLGTGGANFQLYLDGIELTGTSGATFVVSDIGRIMGVQITKKTGPIAPGVHVLMVAWFRVGLSGSARILPVTRPRSDHASLLVRQVNAT